MRAGPREKVHENVCAHLPQGMILNLVWSNIIPILGLFPARESACLYCDLWGSMPWNQYSDP